MTDGELVEIEARASRLVENRVLFGAKKGTEFVVLCPECDCVIESIGARNDICALLAEVRKLREWKMAHRGFEDLASGTWECINHCHDDYFASIDTIEHSPNCPDFTVDGALK